MLYINKHVYTISTFSCTCLGSYVTRVIRSGTSLHGATNTHTHTHIHIYGACGDTFPPKNKYGACEAADYIILNTYTTSYTDFDLDRSFTDIFPNSNLAPEGGEHLSGEGYYLGGGTFILDKMFTSPLIFPTGRTEFPPHLPPSP